jgi:hypothetical protein
VKQDEIIDEVALNVALSQSNADLQSKVWLKTSLAHLNLID